MVRISERRFWLFKRRIHHGAVGVVLGLAALVLCLHDRRDWRDWLRFERLLQEVSPHVENARRVHSRRLV